MPDLVWTDPRFLRLCLMMGDLDKAVGQLVRAYRLAKKYWCPLREPVAKAAWEKEGLGQELVEVGFAKVVCGGYYLDGTDEYYKSWFQKRDAGVKGGMAKRSPSARQANAKRPLPDATSKNEQLERIFAAYPKRNGGQEKTIGFTRISKLSPADLDLFEQAVKNYAAQCLADGKVGTEYIKMFSSFTSEKVWRDWINPARPAAPKMKSIEEALAEMNLEVGA